MSQDITLEVSWYHKLLYLAPGFSYDQFLKAYECTQTKGYSPYEWVDSLDKLNFPTLPPPQAFHSTLSGTDITVEQYSYCQRVWNDNNMETFRDLLVWYNNLDAVPFLEVIDKIGEFWKDRSIEIFKEGVSVPGLTMKYLFTNVPDTYFSLFSEKEKDFYNTMKDNNVDGPSIICNGYHEKEKTFIRNAEMTSKHQEPKPLKNFVEYDANTLYLWAIMQDIPTGQYTRRLESDGFKTQWSGNDEYRSDISTTTRRKELELVAFQSMDFVPKHKRYFNFTVNWCFNCLLLCK